MTDTAPTLVPQKKSPMPVWIVLGIGIVFVAVWMLFLRPQIRLRNSTDQPGVGKPLPVLELQPLTGVTEGVSLKSLQGKVALVNFWGTWCGPCVEEFPHMLDLWERLRGNPDFAFISVSSTFADRENVSAVRDETAKFLQSRSTTMPTYIDADGASRQMLADVIGMQSLAYPTTVVLDRHGIIRGVWVGFDSGDQLQMEQLISRLLAEQRSAEVNQQAAPAVPSPPDRASPH